MSPGAKKRSSVNQNTRFEKRSKSTVSKENDENADEGAFSEGAASAGPSTSTTENADWVDVLDELKFKYEVSVDKKGINLFIQDTFMEEFYIFYPQFVCIDVVCEIPELKKFLVLFIGIDGNGHCQILAAGFLKSETSEDIVWICEVFKQRNQSWDKIELILSDQIFNTHCLKTVFREKKVVMSFFHSMKAFKKDLTSLENAVTEQDINSALQLFEKLLFQTTYQGYLDLNKQMKRMNTPVFRFFRNKWHRKRDFWALGLLTDSKTLLKAFNIYLLSIRRKLKPIISSQETLENVIRNLHSLIYKLRKEWVQGFSKIFHSPTAPYLRGSVMRTYARHITPFACELIIEQLKKSDEIKNVRKVDRPTYYSSGDMLANTYRCFCNFHKLMKLPCRHIFAVRRYRLLPLFTMAIRSSWILTNNSSNYDRLFFVHVSAQEETRARMMSHRFEEYVQVCHQKWDRIFDHPETMSQRTLETFQNAIKPWKNGFEVSLVRSEKDDDALLSDSFEVLEDLPTDYFKELFGISIKDIMDIV